MHPMLFVPPLMALGFGFTLGCAREKGRESKQEREIHELLASIERRLDAHHSKTIYRDEIYGIIAVREAMKALREGSGGVGACLVDERNGKVVERGHNSQYTPYFRSDLHAEMDLLNRYEDRLKKKGGSGSTTDPRRADHMVLVSSVEPCPMCLTRIINSGIEKMYYVIDDPDGGMVSRLVTLPPFWRQQLKGRDYRKASCSPEVQSMSRELFTHSMAKTMARMKRRATTK